MLKVSDNVYTPEQLAVFAKRNDMHIALYCDYTLTRGEMDSLKVALGADSLYCSSCATGIREYYVIISGKEGCPLFSNAKVPSTKTKLESPAVRLTVADISERLGCKVEVVEG